MKAITIWQPIETAPERGEYDPYVLVAEPRDDGTFSVGEAHLTERDGWYWAGNDPSDVHGGQIFPSHWMPLPQPPATAKGCQHDGGWFGASDGHNYCLKCDAKLSGSDGAVQK